MTINSTTRKTNPFTGNGSAHTFPFTFKVFTDADIVVKKLEASTSIETTLTLGLNNDYIVTLNADQNSNPGGSVTLKSGGNNSNLPNGFSLVITSDVDALQGTDLTNQGGFFPEVINDALDKAIIIHQQQQTELDRSIRFSLTNTIGSLEITENAATRANKVLGFDNLGEFNIVQELGTYKGNWAAGRAYVVRDLVKDTNTNNIFMCNAAHTSSGAQPLTTNTDSAKWDLIVDAATATTSSTNAASSATAAANSATAAANSATAAASSQTAAASSATTASTKATEADTAKTAAQTAQTAAETAKTAAETALDSFDDRYLGAKSSNPTLDNDGNALIDGALYFNTTVNRMRVYDLGNTTWLEVTISGSDLTNTNTVAGAISNVNAVGGNISNVNAVASNATNINAVNSNSSNINTVAGAASNISTVSGSIANVNTVGGGIANVNTVAAEINNNKLQTVANNINAVVTAANDLNEATSEIDTVANNIANVNNVGNNISNVNSVAGIASNVTAVAGNASNVNTVANAITNVNNVGGSIANVNTVASNLSGVNSFAERYRTDNTGNNPSTSLNAGDLFYNQASGKLLVYNGQTSAWEETQSVGNFFINTISSFSGTGGNSATFNGSAYKFTLSNAGQFAQQMLVSINGVVQKPNTGTGQPSEGFALDGANIVFSSPPPSGADFFIVTIGASVSIGTPSDGTVTEAKLNVSNNPVNGYFLQAQSGAAGGLTWAQVTTDLVGDSSPQLGGDLQSNGNDIDFADNDKAIFGTSGNLEIYSTGSESLIHENATGNLKIKGTNLRLADSSNNLYMFMTSGAGIEMYHSGSKKCETTSTGINISGSVPTITLSDTDGSTPYSTITAGGGDLVFDADKGNEEANTVIRFVIDDSEKMRLTDAGNLGIGTVSPDTPLTVSRATTGDVFKGLSTNNNTRSRITLQGKDSSGNAVTLTLGGDGDFGGMVFTHSNHKLGFATNNAAPQMILDTSGKVGIGTAAPDYTLTMQGADATGGFYAHGRNHYLSNRSTTHASLTIKKSNADSDALDYLQIRDSNNNLKSSITGAGNWKPIAGGGIDFSATSDASGMTNELLDDYEEGTFTLTLTKSDGSSSTSGGTGHYTKIGRWVNCWGQVTFGNAAANIGGAHCYISGWPFATGSHSSNDIPIWVWNNGSNVSGDVSLMSMSTSTGSTTWSVFVHKYNTASAVSGTQMGNGARISMGLSYEAPA